MIVVIAQEVWKTLKAFGSAVSHVCAHLIEFCFRPSVFKYGACSECGETRWEAAQAKRNREEDPYGVNRYRA